MYLLDTNVVSELRKVRSGRVDPNFAAWARNLRWSELYLSAITIHELELGVSRLETYDLVQAQILRLWLQDKVINGFQSRILPVDTPVAIRSARLQITRTRQLEDALIAATALEHRMTVITRNVGDFDDTGVSFLNPWFPLEH